MTDGDASYLVADALSDPHYSGRITPRLLLTAGVLYALTMCGCWEELRFGASAVILPGTVVDVRPGPKQSQHLRYEYTDPESGQSRRNTVNVGRRELPNGRVIDIQVLPGAILASRPAFQARPALVHVVVIAHGLVLIGGVWMLMRWAREANSRPLTRQQRAVARLRQLRTQQSAN